MFNTHLLYKCDNSRSDIWHDHIVTQLDIEWHSSVLNVKAEKVPLVKTLGKWHAWYMAIEFALKNSQKQSEIQTYFVVPRHPFPNCCLFQGRKSDYFYPRQPLKQIKHYNQNHANESVRNEAKPLPLTPPWQPLHPQQQKIMPDVNDDENHASEDENDTLDRAKPHCPLHHQYPSKSIVLKAKAKQKKRR